MLDGEVERLEVDVEFSRIATIAKEGDAGVRVTLRSGRSLGLGGSNDVDRGNKGIVVTDATGEAHLVAWREFVQVEFEHPEGS